MIPLSTTRISVLRLNAADEYAEPYQGTDETNRTVVAQHVRAVVSRPSSAPAGHADVAGGVQQITQYVLTCDLTDLDYRDLIRDESDERTYRLDWYITYPGSHCEAGLRDIEGEL